MKQPLTEKQKERLHILESKLDKAVSARDFALAGNLVKDIQDLIRPTGHYTRLVQSKNKLYELAIELGKFSTAERGLDSNRMVLNKNTRIYLETTALLAICYLRMREVEKAKPFISEVLRNKEVIKSDRTREIFHSQIINRFTEEISLCSLKSDNKPHFDEEEIEGMVFRIIQTPNDEDIFSEIGKTTPKSAKDLIFLIYDFSTKQLPSAERLALPSPDQKVKDAEVGQTVFHSVKRVIYNSLCNPESEIYKVWFSHGMKTVLNKGYIRTAVLTCFVHLGIGFPLIAASVIALIIKFGIEVYCDRYKPISLMEIRKV